MLELEKEDICTLYSLNFQLQSQLIIKNVIMDLSSHVLLPIHFEFYFIPNFSELSPAQNLSPFPPDSLAGAPS